MKRNTITFLALIVVIVMMGGCGNTAWDELPEPIVKFVSEYFPFGEISSYNTNNNGSVVQIKNGATLSFDSNYDWTDVNGNGQTLPQQFLYDKLPEALYAYLQSMEALNDTYRATRHADSIVIKLLDSTVEYDESTGTITDSGTASSSGLLF